MYKIAFSKLDFKASCNGMSEEHKYSKKTKNKSIPISDRLSTVYPHLVQSKRVCLQTSLFTHSCGFATRGYSVPWLGVPVLPLLPASSR